MGRDCSLDFKRLKGNSQIDEKEQARDKQILAGPSWPPRNKGTQRESNKWILLGSSLSATLSSYHAKVIALFKQVFLSKFL